MEDLPVSLNPQSGEIWVADLTIIDETAEQIKYQLVDSSGKAYGKVLMADNQTFQQRFGPTDGFCLMRLKIIETKDGSVLYQEVDFSGKPIFEPKRINLTIFVRSFKKHQLGQLEFSS